uniref:(northern house mosquito) hypothetical protein n=1 Tax=Culex pipiens TaxID=7175 RepID=A0A8D8C7Q7_CULPI
MKRGPLTTPIAGRRIRLTKVRKGNLQQRRLEAINNPHQSVTSSGRCRMRFHQGRQLEHCRPFMDSPNLEVSRKRTSRSCTFRARAPRGKGSWYTALQLQFNVSRKHTRKESGQGSILVTFTVIHA